MHPNGEINVVCGQCSLVFSVAPWISAIHAPGGVSPHVEYEPCPRCGGVGSITSARQGRTAAGEHVILTTNYDRVLVDLLAYFQRADIERTMSASDAAAKLEAAAPKLAPLAAWLRRNEHLATWLSVVLAVLAILLSQAGDGMTDEQVEQVIQRVVESQVHAADTPPSAGERPGRAPSRNAPCWCASGLKYKHCHGHPEQRARPGDN